MLSERRLVMFLFLVVIFTLAARQVVDPDFWWHLKAGELVVTTRSIPHTDFFSATFSGRPWITHEWLSESVIYLIYRGLGYPGLIAGFALLITAGFGIALTRFAARVSHPFVAGGVLLLGGLAAAPTWNVRPQIFSFFFASVWLALLDRHRKAPDSRTIWWLVPLMIIWANAHAGFALGPVLTALTIVGVVLEGLISRGETLALVWPRVRIVCLVLVCCLGVIVINPNGVRLYSYPVETLTSHAMMKYIEEWWSPNFHELLFQPLAVFMLATFAALSLSRKRIGLADLLLLMATAWAALRSGRNIPFFVLVALPLLAEHAWDWLTAQSWGAWFERPEKVETGRAAMIKTSLNVVLLVVAPLLMAALRVGHSVAGQPATEAKWFPAAATEYLKTQQSPQPIFNEYGWGGYLIWKLYPQVHVFIDGRADVYGDAFFEEYMSVNSGEPGWREKLDQHDVRTVMVKPDAALASLLRQDSGWEKAFEDQSAVIFIRRH